MSIFDATGLIGVGVLASTGTIILPYKKRQLKKDFVQKIAKIRVGLKDSLDHHFEKELNRSILNLRDNISPYTRFINHQIEKIKTNGESLKEIQKNVNELEAKSELLFK